MGLTVSNTTVTALGQRLVTKADTASATSLGNATVATDSGVAGTLGSWVQIIASTAAESYVTDVGIALATTISASDFPIFIQLGTGGAGSEVVKWERIVPVTGTSATFGIVVPVDPVFRVTASKRIAVRASVNSVQNRSLPVYVYGLPITQTEGN